MRLAALLLVCGGCGFAEVHEAVLRPPAAPSRRVEVYVERAPLPRPVDDVAVVQVFASGDRADPQSVLDVMAARGSALGCDAIVRARVDSGGSLSVGSGVCVKWQRAVTR